MHQRKNKVVLCLKKAENIDKFRLENIWILQ
jgi:hypothetical protein